MENKEHVKRVRIICYQDDNWYKGGEEYEIHHYLKEEDAFVTWYDYMNGYKNQIYILAKHCEVLVYEISNTEEHVTIEEVKKALDVPQYTGGSSDYYKVFVKNPTTLPEPYEAECNDVIEALEMTFAEGNAFKAIWRKAKARLGVKKKGYDNGVYDSEKVVFFGERMLVQAKEGNEVV